MREKEGREKGMGNRMCRAGTGRAGTETGLTMAAIGTALVLCILVLVCAISAVQVSVMPPYQEVGTGENFTVSIYVDPEGSEVYGAQYDLYFVNSLLNATAQTKGPFLGDNTWVKSEINNSFNSTHGITKYGETILGGSAVTQPGVLANITFQAIAEENGVSELWLDRVKLYDPEGHKIENVTLNHGNVSVKVGTCGDVVGNDGLNWGDAMRLMYNRTYPGNPKYPLSSEWAGDVVGNDGLNWGDAMRLMYNRTYPGNPKYPLNCP